MFSTYPSVYASIYTRCWNPFSLSVRIFRDSMKFYFIFFPLFLDEATEQDFTMAETFSSFVLKLLICAPCSFRHQTLYFQTTKKAGPIFYRLPQPITARLYILFSFSFFSCQKQATFNSYKTIKVYFIIWYIFMSYSEDMKIYHKI